ncbi:hypothetical protein GCM10028895_18650 [Pontibacter rugosus]
MEAVDVHLTSADLEGIENLLAKYPNTGNRYNEAAMKMVDRSI